MIFRNILSDDYRFLDKAYNIQMPLVNIPSLSTQLNDIYMVTYPEQHNQVIYSKDNSDYCLMEYIDMRNGSGKGVRMYVTSETGNGIQFYDNQQLQVINPYLSTLQYATPQQSNNYKLLSFHGLNRNITSINECCFYDCQNLSNSTFPFVTTIGDYAFHNCTSLKFVSFNSVSKEYMQDNYYRIKMPCDCVCHCSDGDYTIPNYDY